MRRVSLAALTARWLRLDPNSKRCHLLAPSTAAELGSSCSGDLGGGCQRHNQSRTQQGQAHHW
jgi:hypothetical protein